jgi:GNAT superfamily N-acetyltransferase
MVELRPVTGKRVEDVGTLFATHRSTDYCWCAWFLIPVKEFHAGTPGDHRARFLETVSDDGPPAGLLAYRDDEPVGWCSTGPRERYARAIRTPSFAGRDPAEDANVWLVPCLYVRREARRTGVAREMLAGAVELAAEHGATAIEGFPYSGEARRPAADAFVGAEPLFAGCGFRVVRRPSPTRVVMRRDLAEA